MSEEKNMKQNKSEFSKEKVGKFILWLGVCYVFLFIGVDVCAQDPKPVCALPDTHSAPIYPSEEIRELMQFVSVESPMPSSFSDTEENIITDAAGSLYPFWEKLRKKDRPVRIVHIGDSHVRGHVFPYVMRRALEEDFGDEAVENRPVDYRTSGLARETGRPGVVYHILGVNGATTQSFCTSERMNEIMHLHPDLVIVSFGTNEAHGWRYQSAEHRVALERLITFLKENTPGVCVLLTTPPGAYVRNGRRGKVVNPRTARVVDTELAYAKDKGLAVWNLYQVVGGKKSACRNWTQARLFRTDKIHFTREGYVLQGLLLHEAFIKAYNHYVATGLE